MLISTASRKQGRRGRTPPLCACGCCAISSGESRSADLHLASSRPVVARLPRQVPAIPVHVVTSCTMWLHYGVLKTPLSASQDSAMPLTAPAICMHQHTATRETDEQRLLDSARQHIYCVTPAIGALARRTPRIRTLHIDSA